MSVTLPDHDLQWVTAPPLWDREPDEVRRPALLRFETDTFMDDLAALLLDDPDRLSSHVAEAVTYRPGPPASPAPEPGPLKLFLAVHGQFSLVAASLVCRRAGLPEHPPRRERGERAGFVLRRRETHADGTVTELAWIRDADAPKGRWGAAGTDVAAGEEILPLFGLPSRDGDRSRQVLVGLIPTASGEQYRNAGPAAMTGGDGSGDDAWDPRVAALTARVVDPLREMQKPVGGDFPAVLHAGNVEASRFLLLDLAERIAADLPDVWDALEEGRTTSSPLFAGLLDRLVHDPLADPDRATGVTWGQALLTAWRERREIWGEAEAAPTQQISLERSRPSADAIATLLEGVYAATPIAATTGTGLEPAPGPATADVPKLTPAAQYHLRCVYRRPECGPLVDDVVSEPSEPFEIASFFDVDAPARPLSIGLPLDTSITDLRKFKKNVTVVLSKELREQMARASDLTKLMTGNIGSGEALNVGLICQLSIPIITICALILLMIVVNILNLVFQWMPFFRICFPARVGTP